MYKVYLFIFTIFHSHFLYNQILVSNPNFPKENESVTIFFDASKGTAGLKDCGCSIYLHTGVITDKSTSNADWKYVQTSWGVTNPIWEMKQVPGKPNVFSFEIIPSIRSFYKVPAGERIISMAFVFRNANGSKEGKEVGSKDIFYPVFQNFGLSGTIQEPVTPEKLLNPGEPFTIKALFSETVNISLFDNDSLVSNQIGTSISFTWIPNYRSNHQIIILARSNNGDSLNLQTSFWVVPEPKRLSPPENYALGFQRLSDNRVRISVEAPGKKHLFLLGDFNDWKINTNFIFNVSEDGNLHWIEVDSVPSEKPFQYQLALNNAQRFADPYAHLVLDPDHDKFISPLSFPGLPAYPVGKTSGIVTHIDPTLHDYEWRNTFKNKPLASDLIIYELHLRDFLDAPNYKKLKDTLDYLIKLGINAIELMPVNEFEGNNSWGYNPSYHLALDKFYGSPVFFKSFIDECHKKGIAVIIDIVLNHAFSQSPLCRMFWDESNSRPSTDNPWFNQVAKHDFNVGYDFNHESKFTRDFSKRVLSYWLKEYKIDGFRFDLSKGFTQKNTLGNTSAWGNYDASRVAIWQDYSDHLRNVNPDVYIILEHFADVVEEIELAKRGMLLWGNLNHQFNEATMGYPSNLSGLDFKKRNFPNAAIIQYMESHDEERLMFRNTLYGKQTGTYNTRNLTTALQRMEMAFTIFTLSPGPKMIWQFGELGYDYSINTCENGSINNNCRLSPKPVPWSYLNQQTRKKLNDIVSSLNALRLNYNVFKELPVDYDLSSFLKYMHYKNEQFDAIVMANSDVVNATLMLQGVKTGWWYSFFTSDSVFISQNNFTRLLKPGEYQLFTSIKLPNPTKGFIPTSIFERENQDFTIDIFPNPSHRFFDFTYHGPKMDKVELFLVDASGRMMTKLLSNESLENGYYFRLDLGNYPIGIYFLNLFSGAGQKSFLLSKIY